MPKKGENTLKFNNFHKQLPVPFVIYADFEAVTIPIGIHSSKMNIEKVQEQNEETHRDEKEGSYTKAYQTHEGCGCNKYSKPIQMYQGENAVY